MEETIKEYKKLVAPYDPMSVLQVIADVSNGSPSNAHFSDLNVVVMSKEYYSMIIDDAEYWRNQAGEFADQIKELVTEVHSLKNETSQAS